MSKNPIVQYFNQALSIDGFVIGTQSISIDQSMPANKLTQFGQIQSDTSTKIRVFRPRPEVKLDVVRPLDKSSAPLINTGVDQFLKYYGGISSWDTAIKKYNLEFAINREDLDSNGKIHTGGTSLKFRNFLLSEARYTFSADSTFAEERLGFVGNTVEKGTGLTSAGTGKDSGNVVRRQDFSKVDCTFPTELQSLFDANRSVLKEVSLGFSINWNTLQNFGEMNNLKYKFMSLPIDISCSFTIVDFLFDQVGDNSVFLDSLTGNMSDILFTGTDFVPNRQIIIVAGGTTFDLGDKNYLVSRNRKGGEAGSNSYSTYTYEYKNVENFIKITRG
jgi:hypothetical protein